MYLFKIINCFDLLTSSFILFKYFGTETYKSQHSMIQVYLNNFTSLKFGR